MQFQDEEELLRYGMVLDPSNPDRAMLAPEGAMEASVTPSPCQPAPRNYFRDLWEKLHKLQQITCQVARTPLRIAAKRVALAIKQYEDKLDQRIAKLNRKSGQRK